MTLNVVIPIGKLSDGSTVTKVNGQKKYTVLRKIRIYSEAKELSSGQEINVDDGCVFMVSNESVTVVPASKNVLWETDLDELNAIQMEQDSK